MGDIPFSIENCKAFIRLMMEIQKTEITSEDIRRYSKELNMLEMKEELMEIIGASCRRWRLSMDYRLDDVSKDTGYKISTISRFESGKNNSALILFWYLAHGFNPDNRMVDVTDNKRFTSACNVLQGFLKRGKKDGH